MPNPNQDTLSQNGLRARYALTQLGMYPTQREQTADADDLLAQAIGTLHGLHWRDLRAIINLNTALHAAPVGVFVDAVLSADENPRAFIIYREGEQ